MLKKFNRFEEAFLIGTLAVMVILIFSQVVGRYLLQSAPSWTEEVARYIHVFQVWVGAGYAVKLGEHIRVSAFINMFRGKARKILEMLAIFIWFILALFLAYLGTKLVFSTFGHGQVSPAIQLPFWIPFLAIPLGGLSMAIRLIQQLKKVYKTDYDKPGELIE